MVRCEISIRTCVTFAFVLSLVSVACVVNEPEAPSRSIVVNGPPPPPVHETKPPSPAQEATWVQGYWHWTGMRYTWIPGHWETPPPGATWSAPVYSNRDGRYLYENGRWSSPTQSRALR